AHRTAKRGVGSWPAAHYGCHRGGAGRGEEERWRRPRPRNGRHGWDGRHGHVGRVATYLLRGRPPRPPLPAAVPQAPPRRGLVFSSAISAFATILAVSLV